MHVPREGGPGRVRRSHPLHRAIHTNFRARFSCDVLKLAMIKTGRLAQKLFNGSLYDCVCVYTPPRARAGPASAGAPL